MNAGISLTEYVLSGAYGDPSAYDRVAIITPSPADVAGTVATSVNWTSGTTKHLFGSFSVAGVQESGGSFLPWSNRSGCTLISPHWACFADHASHFAKARFLTQAGSIVEATVDSETTIAGIDIGLVRFTTAVAGVPVIPVVAEVLSLASLRVAFLETDRLVTLATAESSANIGTTELGVLATTHDLVAPDSGKPGIILIAGQPALVVTGLHFGSPSASGPTPGNYIPQINTILAADGEGLKLARIGGVGSIGLMTF